MLIVDSLTVLRQRPRESVNMAVDMQLSSSQAVSALQLALPMPFPKPKSMASYGTTLDLVRVILPITAGYNIRNILASNSLPGVSGCHPSDQHDRCGLALRLHRLGYQQPHVK